LVTVAHISNIYDKGRAAIIIILIEARTEEGEPVFDNEAVLYYIGGGGFGGDRGPKREVLRPREGADPDFRVAYSIPENQAALYRLSGDLNPLHIDPELAKKVRFDKPILHGLCAFGYATRAILHSVCDADVSRFKEFRTRFVAPVYPGETLNVEGWKHEGGRFIMQARTARAKVLTNGCAVVGE
jgi:acyl dehydratase